MVLIPFRWLRRNLEFATETLRGSGADVCRSRVKPSHTWHRRLESARPHWDTGDGGGQPHLGPQLPFKRSDSRPPRAGGELLHEVVPVLAVGRRGCSTGAACRPGQGNSPKMLMGPSGRFRRMRMAVRMLPADVGVAWLRETVPKIDAGALTSGCPPIASRTRVSVS